MIPTEFVDYHVAFQCGPHDGRTEERSGVIQGSITIERSEYLLSNYYLGLDKKIQTVYVFKEVL